MDSVKTRYDGLVLSQLQVPRDIVVFERAIPLGAICALAFYFAVLRRHLELSTWTEIFGFTVGVLLIQWIRWTNYQRLKKDDPQLAEVAFYNPVDGYFRKRRGWINS